MVALWDLVVTEPALMLYIVVLVVSHRSTEPVDCTEIVGDLVSNKCFRGPFLFKSNLTSWIGQY